MYSCLQWLRGSWRPTCCPRWKPKNAAGPTPAVIAGIICWASATCPGTNPSCAPTPNNAAGSVRRPTRVRRRPPPPPWARRTLNNNSPQNFPQISKPKCTIEAKDTLFLRSPSRRPSQWKSPAGIRAFFGGERGDGGVGFAGRLRWSGSKCRENEMWTQPRLPKLKKKKSFPGLWLVRHNPWQLFYLWRIFRHKIQNCPSQIFLHSRAPVIPSQISLVRHKLRHNCPSQFSNFFVVKLTKLNFRTNGERHNLSSKASSQICSIIDFACPPIHENKTVPRRFNSKSNYSIPIWFH